VTRPAAALLFLVLAPAALGANATDDLLKAAGRGDAAGIVKALGRGARIGAADQLGRTALHLAAARGDAACVEILAAKGAPLGARDADGLTPLLRAARGLQGAVVDLLLSRGADRQSLLALLGARDAAGRTLLHAAALKGAAAAAAAFIRAGTGADPADAAGRTPLSLAAASAGGQSGERRRAWLATARVLLEAGADPGRPDSDGCTPLWYAVREDDGELALMLSEKGVDVGSVSEAYERGDNRIARVLTDRITDASAADTAGSTFLHVAARQGIPELAARALELMRSSAAGPESLAAQVDRQDRFGRTALALAASRGDEEVARLLLESGADPNRPGERGATPLVLAARQGHPEVADVLLSAGAEASPRGRTTPLHEAVQERSLAVAGLLLSRGGDINARDEKGNTPLYYAVETRTGTPGLELVRLLLDTGAAADERNAGGATALLRAVQAGKVPETALLLSRGADPDAADGRGMTPRTAAWLSGDGALMRLLGLTGGSSR
jgi:ankyrin repeat protein